MLLLIISQTWKKVFVKEYFIFSSDFERVKMDYKSLLSSCQTVLSKHSLFSPRNSSPKATTNFPDSEEDILLTYFSLHPQNQPEQEFISTVLFGCVRHFKTISTTNDVFYSTTGARLLKSKFNLFCILSFVTIFQPLEFHQFRQFVKACGINDAISYMKFIFDSKNISKLKQELNKILDHLFVDDIICLLERYMEQGNELVQELIEIEKHGQIPAKIVKPPTKDKSFILTVPNERKFPYPPVKISSLFVAKPVPKSVYTGTKDRLVLEQKKIKNKEKCIKNSSFKQFQVAERISKDTAKLNEEREKILASRIESEKNQVFKYKPSSIKVKEPTPIKTTTAAILREGALVQKKKKIDENALTTMVTSLANTDDYALKVEEERIKEDLERKQLVKRRYVEVKILHEEVKEAKEEFIKQKRDIVKELIDEKTCQKILLEETRKQDEQEKKKVVDSIQSINENVEQVRKNIISQKAKNVAEINREKELLKVQAEKQAKEELDRKTDLIAQIRLLEKSITTHSKTVDFTESSGIGFLNEMSIVELQERLIHSKLRKRDEEEIKRSDIVSSKKDRLAAIAQKLVEIESERQERRANRNPKVEENESLKRLTLFEDPVLKQLYVKLELKKAARRDNSSIIENSKKTLEKHLPIPTMKSRIDQLELDYAKRKAGILEKMAS